MSGTNSVIDGYKAAFDTAAAELPGHREPWVQDTRERALARVSELGFPTPRDEDWKYTRPTPITKRVFRPLSSSGSQSGAPIPDFSEHSGHRVVFIDGRFHPAASRLGELPPGAVVTDLATALTHEPGRLRTHIERCTTASRDGFTALNTAFFNEGALIFVPRGTVLREPIQLVFYTSASAADAHLCPRVVVVVEEDGEATVVESFLSGDKASYFTNTFTDVVLGKSARLEHYKHQAESIRAFHVATLQVHQDSHSSISSHALSVGGALARTDIEVTMAGVDAECTLNGLYLVGGRQHVDFHTRIEHVAPGSVSREHYRGIIDGRARAVFNGKVYVHPKAQKTDAQQSNHNLLLSREAEVDTKPQLEIYADDVKCAHGATVGQLDENMVYYLRSRGIDDDSARGMLTYGFAQQVLETMQHHTIRNRLHTALLQYLPNAAQIKELIP